MKLSRRITFYRHMALFNYFLLLGWVILWHSALSPHPHINTALMTVIWSIPLLFPLKGIIAADPYTHAWANFIFLLYFLHSITLLAVDSGEQGFALIELILVSISFFAHIGYARTQGKAFGLTLKRLSEIEKEEKNLLRSSKHSK